jgi:hypothetical protein
MTRGTAVAIETWAKSTVSASRGLVEDVLRLQELGDAVGEGCLFGGVEGRVETTRRAGGRESCAGRSWARAWVLRLPSLGLYERDCAGKDEKRQIQSGEAHFRSPFSLVAVGFSPAWATGPMWCSPRAREPWHSTPRPGRCRRRRLTPPGAEHAGDLAAVEQGQQAALPDRLRRKKWGRRPAAQVEGLQGGVRLCDSERPRSLRRRGAACCRSGWKQNKLCPRRKALAGRESA